MQLSKGEVEEILQKLSDCLENLNFAETLLATEKVTMPASLHADMLIYAALGAFALWLRLKYGASILGGIEHLVDEILDDFSVRGVAKFLLFVTFGAIISAIMVAPGTARQAMAAGMAWTSLLGRIATPTKKGRAHAAARNPGDAA